MMDLERYMRRCLFLAQKGRYDVAPNPMVGAVLVDASGGVLGEGWHTRFGAAHAEVECLRAVEARYSGIDFSQTTLFVNLEPCSHHGKTPPCADLLIAKGVGRVVVGCLDPNPLVAGKGIEKLFKAGIEVITNVLQQPCRGLNKRFFCFHEKKRPYIILKWAQTADGFLDALRKDSQTPPVVISTPITKQLVHKMRAENMAILVGTNTAVLDNPKLTNTRWCGHNPIRLTIDRTGRIPNTHHLKNDAAQTIIYAEKNWEKIVQDLYARQIHSVLVEGGRKLLDSIIDSGLYDEVHIEIGHAKLGMEGIAAPPLRDARACSEMLTSAQNIDGNVLLTARMTHNK